LEAGLAVGARRAIVDDSHTFFWLVGLLEGEGYFGYTGGRPRIEVEMKDEQVIARIAALLRRSYSRRDRRDNRTDVSVTYRMAVSGRVALQLMKRMQPYMSPRRQRTISSIEERYFAESRAPELYDRFPLPPLTEVPYGLGG
jgi:hypothetical protein